MSNEITNKDLLKELIKQNKQILKENKSIMNAVVTLYNLNFSRDDKLDSIHADHEDLKVAIDRLIKYQEWLENIG